ncbi:hypothetical protein [Neofamilia massiliensis]|uniref:hypothetical protein n=1 Tax=Neofamilia massiliensis TaxID=1673724 RepID=UPI0006BB6E91|nr:hypothetical protein [Neofamilia massiliensis]
MKTDLKAMLKNKVIIFILLFLTILYIIFASDLKNTSIAREEANYLSLEGLMKFDAMWKENDLLRAKSQDTSSDKKLYNNYKDSYDWSTREVHRILKKYSEDKKVPDREFAQCQCLASLIRNEHYSGLYGENQISPYKAYPRKIDKFLEDINFPYNFQAINFLSPSEEFINQKDLLNYNILAIENKLDSYFLKATLPNTSDYNIYNFIRLVNYGQLGSFIEWMENFFISIVPLVIFYLLIQQKSMGTIKNTYLRPKKKYMNYLYLLILFFIFSLVLVYLPKIISYLYVLVTGERYKAFTDITVVDKGLRSFETAFENKWIDSGTFGMTNVVNGLLGDTIEYSDLKNISFLSFIFYVISIDLLKLTLLVITATSISLFIKNKIFGFVLNGAIGTMTFLGGKINSRFFLNKFNPFILPNGWKLTLGREYISYFNAFVLLIGWIILMLGISLFLARKRDLE